MSAEQFAEETGKVVGVMGERAEVQVAPEGGCAHCGAASFCNWTGKREKTVLALNPIGASVGEMVVLSRRIRPATHSALLVFGLPALLMILGVIVGALLVNDLWAAILAGAGVVLGFLLVKVVDRAKGKAGKDLPVIVRRFKTKGEKDEKEGIDIFCLFGTDKHG
ncbi:MAG: SoxR reducing system RseC family protein [candidate division WOR-3 bacterium]